MSENMEKTADEIERVYGLLTSKQKAAVDVLVEDDHDTMKEGANEAGVSASYLYWCEDEYDYLIEYRQTAMRYATDGSGSGEYVDVRLTEDEAFKAIRILPAELSQVVYQAVKK